MAAHRYWRAVNLESYGFAGLELSEFQLLVGAVRVDTAATLTSNIAPTTGSLANLKDDSTATSCAWSFSALRALMLSWDFGGSPQDVTDIRLGSAVDPVKFLLSVKLQWSDNATAWTDFGVAAGISWPGAKAKTTSLTFDSDYEKVGLYLPFNGSAGQVTAPDLSLYGHTAALSGSGGAISTAVNFFGSGSWRGSTSSGLRVTGDLSKIAATGATPWTWEMIYRNDSLAAARVLFDVNSDGSNTTGWQIYIGTDGKLYVYSGPQAVNYGGYGSAMAINTDYRLRVTWDGSVLRFFVDGVLLGTSATGFTNVWGSVVSILNSAFITQGATGWSGQMRWTRGVARSTANYAVETAAFQIGLFGIVRNTVRGRIAINHVASVATPLSVPIVYGRTDRVAPFSGRSDYLTGVLGQGIGRVKGTTKDKGSPSNVPVSERVRLHRMRDGLVIREVWSAPGTGAFSFDYVDELQAYYVVSFDHDLNFRAVVADNLTLAGGGVELIA